MTSSNRSSDEDKVRRIRERHKEALDAGMSNAEASAYANDPNSPALSFFLSSAQVQSSAATPPNGNSGAHLNSSYHTESPAMPSPPSPALSESAGKTCHHELDAERPIAKNSGHAESPDGTRPSTSAPDYVVGYGRAPVEGRFKKGHPKLGGRRKGQRNIGTIIEGFLDERIALREGKRARRMSKRDAMCLNMVNAAVSGSDKALSKVIALTANAQPDEANKQEPFTADDDALLADFLRRFGNQGQSTPENNGNLKTGEVEPPREENNEKKTKS